MLSRTLAIIVAVAFFGIFGIPTLSQHSLGLSNPANAQTCVNGVCR